MKNNQNKVAVSVRRNKAYWLEKAFIYGMIALPLLQLAIFYFAVRIDGILLAFQTYQDGVYFWSGFENFRNVIADFTSGTMIGPISRSLLIYGCGLLMLPVHVFLAFLIWRKIPLSNVFKVLLFLPNVIPGIVFVLVAKYGIEKVFPIIFNNQELALLISNVETGFQTVLIYDLFMGFPGSLIIYLGTIGSVDNSVVEAGRLDGLGMFGEFWHVILPHVYPTVATYFVIGLTGLFTASGSFYSFYRDRAPEQFQTVGYLIFVKTLTGGGAGGTSSNPQEMYGYITAFGLILSAVTIPIVFLVKWLTEHYGPSEDERKPLFKKRRKYA